MQKHKLKPVYKFKNCSQLLYTTRHKTVLIIFLCNIQTILPAHMMSSRGEGGSRPANKKYELVVLKSSILTVVVGISPTLIMSLWWF